MALTGRRVRRSVASAYHEVWGLEEAERDLPSHPARCGDHKGVLPFLSALNTSLPWEVREGHVSATGTWTLEIAKLEATA